MIRPEHRYILIVTLMAIALAMFIIVATNSWGSVKPVDLKEQRHQELLLEIAMLESGNRNIPCAYSETCDEIGPYQYRPKTWAYFQRLSKMFWLSIYDEQDQRVMTDWALRQGLGFHWATFKRAEQNIVIRRYK